MKKTSTAHHSKRTYWEVEVTQYNASGMSKQRITGSRFCMVNIVKHCIAIMILIGIIGAWGCKPQKPRGERNKVPPEITQFVEKLFTAIVNEDIDYIEQILYDG